MLAESNHHGAAHRSGHHWLDLTLAAAATLISVVSVVIALRHGSTMDRMAEANARLVAANSWPFLQYSTANQNDAGARVIRMSVVNAGVGPARIETFEVFWNDAAVVSDAALLAACCGYDPATDAAADSARRSALNQGLVAGRILRAGDALNFLELPRTEAAASVWDRLNAERVRVKFRACFCSVFDECWTGTLVGTRATRAPNCPVAAIPFGIPGTEALVR